MLILQHLGPQQPTKPRWNAFADDLANSRGSKIHLSLHQLLEDLNLGLELLELLEAVLADPSLLRLTASEHKYLYYSSCSDP